VEQSAQAKKYIRLETAQPSFPRRLADTHEAARTLITFSRSLRYAMGMLTPTVGQLAPVLISLEQYSRCDKTIL
jgi:hypothetical protein